MSRRRPSLRESEAALVDVFVAKLEREYGAAAAAAADERAASDRIPGAAAVWTAVAKRLRQAATAAPAAPAAKAGRSPRRR